MIQVFVRQDDEAEGRLMGEFDVAGINALLDLFKRFSTYYGNNDLSGPSRRPGRAGHPSRHRSDRRCSERSGERWRG